MRRSSRSWKDTSRVFLGRDPVLFPQHSSPFASIVAFAFECRFFPSTAGCGQCSCRRLILQRRHRRKHCEVELDIASLPKRLKVVYEEVVVLSDWGRYDWKPSADAY
jgi:hypothetical protein